jgi:hypothetical protein
VQVDGTRVAAAAARLIATSVLGTTDRIHAPQSTEQRG